MAIQLKGGVAPGDLDPSFGEGGKVVLDFPTASIQSPRGLHITPTGKILVVGTAKNNSFIVGCLTEDGKVESSFGQNGTMLGQFLSQVSSGTSVTSLTHGKVLVGGTYYANNSALPAVSRLLASGEFDTTFADGGTFVFPPVVTSPDNGISDTTTPDNLTASESIGTQSIVLPGGGILIGFRTMNGQGLLGLLTEDGVLDESFNSTGYTTVRYPNAATQDTAINAFSITADGKILISGEVKLEQKPTQGMLARYLINGSPDTSFGLEGNGFIAVDIDQHSVRLYGTVNVQEGNFIAFGGMSHIDVPKSRAIASGRTPDGTQDPNFNGGQIAKLDTPLHNRWASAAFTAVTYKFVAAGPHADVDSRGQILIGRYLRSGQLDKEFGRGKGWVTIDHGLEPQLVLQGPDKILTCFRRYDGTSAIARVVN